MDTSFVVVYEYQYVKWLHHISFQSIVPPRLRSGAKHMKEWCVREDIFYRLRGVEFYLRYPDTPVPPITKAVFAIILFLYIIYISFDIQYYLSLLNIVCWWIYRLYIYPISLNKLKCIKKKILLLVRQTQKKLSKATIFTW